MPKKRNKKEKQGLIKIIKNTIKPIKVSPPLSQLTCINNNFLTLEGNFTISDFSKEFVKLDFGKYFISVVGTDLDMLFFNDRSVEIKGKLLNVAFGTFIKTSKQERNGDFHGKANQIFIGKRQDTDTRQQPR